MTDSSGNDQADFADLSVSNVSLMLKCLSELRSLEVEHLEQTYSRYATGFRGVLRFLLAWGLLSQSEGRLVVGPRLSQTLTALRDAKEPRGIVQSICVDMLLNGGNAYCRAVSRFLSRFVLVRGVPRYVPETRERIAIAPLRNFLMDLEVVTLDPQDGSYVLQVDMVGQSSHASSCLSPLVLEAIAKAQARIGLEAEKFVMEIERLRLAPFPGLADRIVHVSQKAANAGFDIKSWEAAPDASANLVPRYIEVKTFGSGAPLFYWSANEIETARRLRGTYWLYLVPHDEGRVFVLSGVERIQDPARLFEDPQGWEIVPDTYRLRRKD